MSEQETVIKSLQELFITAVFCFVLFFLSYRLVQFQNHFAFIALYGSEPSEHELNKIFTVLKYMLLF